MIENSNQQEAIELLQQLGLQEYEAKSFVALARLPQGTAKEVSEISDVPRTRVYDAVRVLESKGLVELQHSSPQQFRSVSVDEAVRTLKEEYDSRIESLRETLGGLEQASFRQESDVTHEVWSLSSTTGITSRTGQLIDEATEEVVLVIGHGSVFTDQLAETLHAAQQRGATVVVGTVSEALRDQVAAELSDVEVFVSELEWLSHSNFTDDGTEIGRLLMVDRSAILVSSYHESVQGGTADERAVFGRGFDNGLVTIIRRLMRTGLLPADDPGAVESG